MNHIAIFVIHSFLILVGNVYSDKYEEEIKFVVTDQRGVSSFLWTNESLVDRGCDKNGNL